MSDFEEYIREIDTPQSINSHISKSQIETLGLIYCSKVQILHFEINQVN
jgi:hypothetical protein